jgi:hypothetical protein
MRINTTRALTSVKDYTGLWNYQIPFKETKGSHRGYGNQYKMMKEEE